MKLHLEEGFTQQLVAEEMGVTVAGLQKWVGLYRRYGEEGLRDRGHRRSGRKLPQAVRDKILWGTRGQPSK